MKDLNHYFDLAKRVTGSDRQTALRMDIAPNRIATARKSGVMGNEFCAKLAKIAAVNPLEVIAAAEIKKHPEKAQFWGQWVAASLATFAILSVVVLGENPANSMEYAAFLPLPLYRLCAVIAVIVFAALILWGLYVVAKKGAFEHGKE